MLSKFTNTDSVTTDEANGLFSVKSELSLTLTRQELEGYFECRVETPALDNMVRNQLHIDLQGKTYRYVKHIFCQLCHLRNTLCNR